MQVSDTLRPLWIEGTMLTQQHLQQLDSSLRARNTFINSIHSSCLWGVLDIEINRELLLNNVFQLENLIGIFPSGNIIKIDDSCNVSVEINSNLGEEIYIYLCWDGKNYASGASGYPQSNDSKWEVVYKNISDQFDADRKKEIAFLKMKTYLTQSANENEKNINIEKLLLAKISNKKSGIYTVDDSHIVPSLDLSKTKEINRKLSLLLSVIEDKIEHLKRVLQVSKKQSSNLILSLEIREAVKCLSYSYTYIKIFSEKKYVQPAELYNILVNIKTRIDSSLCDSVSNISQYEHNNSNKIFHTIFDDIFKKVNSLSFDIKERAKLEKISNNRYKVYIDNIGTLSDSQVILGVNFKDIKIEPSNIINYIKISSPDLIDSLITSSISGIEVTHLNSLPREIIAKHNYEYYELFPHGVHWERIKQENCLDIFIADSISGVDIEVMVSGGDNG